MQRRLLRQIEKPLRRSVPSGFVLPIVLRDDPHLAPNDQLLRPGPEGQLLRPRPEGELLRVELLERL